MGREQRFALLCETLFDSMLCFLPQIAARFARHGIGLPVLGQLGDCARLVAPFIGGRQRRSSSAPPFTTAGMSITLKEPMVSWPIVICAFCIGPFAVFVATLKLSGPTLSRPAACFVSVT